MSGVGGDNTASPIFGTGNANRASLIFGIGNTNRDLGTRDDIHLASVPGEDDTSMTAPTNQHESLPPPPAPPKHMPTRYHHRAVASTWIHAWYRQAFFRQRYLCNTTPTSTPTASCDSPLQDILSTPGNPILLDTTLLWGRPNPELRST